MPNAAIVGTALTDQSAHPYGLFLDQLDVIGKPGVLTYGVPRDSIRVSELASGGVSSMTFSIDDPAIAITVTEAMRVLYYDFTTSLPIFLGFVDHWSYRPGFGGQGRTIEVSATGCEAVLDWALTTVDLTFASGAVLSTCIQSLVLNLVGGVPDLNVFTPAGSITPQGSRQEAPVAGGTTVTTLTYAVTINAGTSLREALRLLFVASVVTFGGGHFPGVVVIYTATIDFWMGLRVTPFPYTIDATFDWLLLDVTDTYAGTPSAANLDLGTEMASYRGVFVKGANANGTGSMDDGTGLPGPYAFISDTTIDTAAKLASAQQTYLQDKAQTQRGTFNLEHVLVSSINVGPTSHFRAGSRMRLVDDAVGSTIGSPRHVWQVDKVFHDAGRETWTISYGGFTPSVVNQTRRLTRTTLS